MTVPNFRWSLYNPADDTEIRWPQNPIDGSLLQREKSTTIDGSTQGAPIIWEGNPKASTMPFTGVILERDHFVFFDTWYKVPGKVRIIDDLGNIVWAYLTKFTPKRVISTSHPWKAEYECSVIVLAFELGGG